MKKRSPQEIALRLRQEVGNLRTAYFPVRTAPSPLALPLPCPKSVVERLRDTAHADSLIAISEGVLRRQFPLLGLTLQAEQDIRWRRDFVSGRETGTEYFRGIPYLDASRVGDHKIIWELNRHQHLVALAQAFLFNGNTDYLEDLWRQLDSWLEANPFCRGINWTSALEVAFRSLSWLWIEHLTGTRMPEPLRRRWLLSFFQHGQFLEHNLSVYFSPNTHLQGEALALHALGLLFGNRRWRRKGAGILNEIIQTHVRPDGAHFEQSSYYHVYATDMFLFHALLEPVSNSYRARLRKMVEYLWALSVSGEIPLLGDDDGGRLFHPYGPRRQFGRATLATCAVFFGDTPWLGDARDLNPQAVWWFGGQVAPRPSAARPSSALFADSGIAVLAEDDITLHLDARGFGVGGAGHSHAHALHFTLKRGNSDVLIDPGTCSYMDAMLRDRFRATAMHNTVRVDGLNQADPAGPFRWSNLPQTSVRHWSAKRWFLDAVCGYRDITHRRQLLWSESVLFVLDSFEGKGIHKLEQFWHVGALVGNVAEWVFELPARVFLCLPDGSATHIEEGGEFGWYAEAPGAKVARPVIRVDHHGPFPARLAAVFAFDNPAPLKIYEEPTGVILDCGGRQASFESF